MTTALAARGVPEMTAAVAGELGVLAFKRGYAAWVENDRYDFGTHAVEALRELGKACTSL